jgi:hypothetical protein
MAGDWIKMRKNLPTDPRVVRIASALDADRLRTLGALFVAWCIFDEHSADGTLVGYTPETLDELVGLPGLSAAMASVGWLDIQSQGIVAPRFTDHNGSSARRRAMEASRKSDVRNLSASQADTSPHRRQTKCGPEKEKEKEKDTPLSPPTGGQKKRARRETHQERLERLGRLTVADASIVGGAA